MKKRKDVQVLLLDRIISSVKDISIQHIFIALFSVLLITACGDDTPDQEQEQQEQEQKCPGHEANIYDSSSAILVNSPTAQDGEFNLGIINEEAIRYWGDRAKEKRFVIPFWAADELLGDSTENSLALRVTNIDSTELVKTEWVAFNSDRIADLCDDASMSYYVIERQRYPDQSNFKSYLGSDYRLMVVARIGKDENGEISVYFSVVSHNFVTVSNCQDCPDGATTGVRVP